MHTHTHTHDAHAMCFREQVRDEEFTMRKCSGCNVARYCNRMHQQKAWKSGVHTQHSIMCGLWRKWRSYRKGTLDAESMTRDLEDFLRKSMPRPQSHAKP